MKLLHRKSLPAAALSLLLPVGFLSAPIAQATEPTPVFEDGTVSTYTQLSPELISQAFDELINSDVPHSRNSDGTVSFELSEGFSIALPDPAMSNGPVPLVNGGTRNGGFWVEFTSQEQDLLISGSGFALGTAICLIPGVGQAACIVIGAIITAATVYLSHHRKCPGSIRFDYNWWGQVEGTRCV
ncbi:hypothetical protein SAMN05660282_00866 [Corynebacterium spheniscorum]|uniref:Uncharacterized protein n=1 Tax=Corynebacterium spheniscorum TaxID=185761 RepID=A0A1I2RRW1_9CORY|nr:hypothetical protein SAMN05660282_00866 [Corynebacterium spheniscorum]